MKGRPLIQVLLFAVAWGLLALPLVRLTGARPPAASADREAEIPGGEHTSAWISVDCTHRPLSLVLTMPDGRVLFDLDAVQAPGLSWEIEALLPDLLHHLELLLLATWPSGTGHTVVRVTVEPDGLPARESNVWVLRGIDTALEFSWEADVP